MHSLPKTAVTSFLTLAVAAAFADARPVPSRNMLERMRSGVDTIGIVHFGINTFTDREWGYGSESPSEFNPTDFSADQIVGACRDGGIQGLVVVAKHHDGFCLWPTKTTEYNVTKSPFGRDYVKEMEHACRKYGLKFGVYCSPWDRNSAAYATDAYVKTFHAQVEELNDGRYGEVFEMWFDGANGGDGYYGGAWEKRSIGVAREYYRYEKLWNRVEELQPNVCFFGGRDGFMYPGTESGIVPPESGGTRDNGTFRIYEADFPLRPGWFYHKSHDGYSRPGEFLMKVYLRTVGNGATMDIGIAPDRRGRLTDEDVGCLGRFAEIRMEFFSKPVKDASTPFNVIVMTEDIEHGERVDEWRVLLDGKELAKGGKIGTKRIRVLDVPVSGNELKLDIVRGDAKPDEIKMELFAADEELVRKVMSSEEPECPPAPFERKGVLTSRSGDTLVFMVKRPQETSSLLLTPDAGALDGTPVAFRVAYSTDGENWTEDEAEHRLDNVEANPIPQSVPLGRTFDVKYIRLKAVRTLKDGAAVHLKGVDLIDDSDGSGKEATRSLRDKIAAKCKIVKEDEWHGFKRTVFDFEGRDAWVVEPKCAPADGGPWTWTMQWADAFVDRTGVLDLLARGWRHVTIDTFANRMDEEGLRVSRAFQRFLVDELGFAPKANLVGMSWGGFFSVRYANAFPGCVAKIYLDAPLMNFDGFAKTGGTPTENAARIGPWAAMPPEGGKWSDDPRMPVNMAEPLARAAIPVFLLYGGQDQTVPPDLNCETFARRYEAHGGSIEIKKRGLFGHHPHGLDPDKTGAIVEFFETADFGRKVEMKGSRK